MILHEAIDIPPDLLKNLRVRIGKVFQRILVADKKRASRMKLDDLLVECFASLPSKCRDEELEDLVYFILDLYQFHGLHIALSEVDIDQVTVELRTALEEHTAKARNHIVPVKDAHLFLVLDKNVQGIPWESIPILRGKSVSRIPSLSLLLDRVEFAKIQREARGLPVIDGVPPDRALVNPKKTYYVLNPGGDLTKSEDRFRTWIKEMDSVGWQGIVGRAPSEQELLNALNNKDLVM
jgi:separase